MTMNKNTTIAIVVVAVVALAGAAYWYVFVGTGNDAPLSPTSSPSQAQLQFETYANQLPLSFNTDVFNDPRFKSLVDINKPIVSEPAGRADPLAPIGTGGSLE